ncbi:hypothetical protein GOY11_34110 [Pseudomonas aeruginosa]|nr:hypothetical protein [Pseudomonas aeruginosa]
MHFGITCQAVVVLDDPLDGTELSDVAAEQDYTVVLVDPTALGQGQQVGVLGVRPEALAILPLRCEARARRRQ